MEQSSIRIKFLGGCGEVGRVGVLIESPKGNKLLLDYGVSLTDEKPLFPESIAPKELCAIFLSHAHLDHSGALPLIYTSRRVPLYTTTLTAKFSRLLIEDMLRLSGYYIPYEMADVKTMMRSVVPVKYGEEIVIAEDICLKVINAGHIPGSAMALLEVGDYTILFTSDFNLIETQLLPPADLGSLDLKRVDMVIMESTYATTEHPERKQCEKLFISSIIEVMEEGGIALVPAFSVGRSQEILCILERYSFGYPITLDGMARVASKILLDHLEFVKDKELLKRALSNARWVMTRGDRRRALKSSGVIVSPAGMLKGGAALYYLQRIYKDRRNAIFLVSYQIPGTPGRYLLETGKFKFNDKEEKVKAKVAWFDFSSHSGRKELLEFASMLGSGVKLILIHGEHEGSKALAEELSELYDLDTYVPRMGEELRVC